MLEVWDLPTTFLCAATSTAALSAGHRVSRFSSRESATGVNDHEFGITISRHSKTRTFAAGLEDGFDAGAGGAYVYAEVF
jgi:uncharacterized membrane protein